jgi:hypothetical protein
MRLGFKGFGKNLTLLRIPPCIEGEEVTIRNRGTHGGDEGTHIIDSYATAIYEAHGSGNIISDIWCCATLTISKLTIRDGPEMGGGVFMLGDKADVGKFLVQTSPYRTWGERAGITITSGILLDIGVYIDPPHLPLFSSEGGGGADALIVILPMD